MREHKYKVYNTHTKEVGIITEIIFGTCVRVNLDHPTDSCFSCPDHECWSPYWSWKDIEMYEFTGLKDKNGREIYEGDIVRTNEAGWIAKVVYHRDGFVCIDNTSFGYSSHCEWGEFEIIGNIYENPELLEKS